MTDEGTKYDETSNEQEAGSEPQAEPAASARQDLAAGLDLVLSAARKAMRGLEPARLEQLGRRAKESLEHLDRRKVEEMGRKAAEKMGPRRIEEIAEEAGRELLSVVERVVERVDNVVGRRASTPPPAEQPDREEEEADPPPSRPRVRIDDESN